MQTSIINFYTSKGNNSVRNIYKLRLKIAAYFISPTHIYAFAYMYTDTKKSKNYWPVKNKSSDAIQNDQTTLLSIIISQKLLEKTTPN